MHIAFRVDSSTIIGYGHVMRCLTLAHALSHQFKTVNKASPKGRQKTNFDEPLFISFICRDHQGHINQLILDDHFTLLQLPPITQGMTQAIIQNNTNTWLGIPFEQDAQQCITHLKQLPKIELMIVDHYAIDHHWHMLMKPYYRKLLVIDDLANRIHACDYLLDQTFNRNKKAYQALVPKHCQLLLGQYYILLRDEFSQLKIQARLRRKEHINNDNKGLSSANIIITMGGTDPDNLSQLTLSAINELMGTLPNITVDVVISSQSIHLTTIQKFCNEQPWANLIIDSKNMAKLMLSADIAIGASGGTAWERCCLGLPCLTIVNAENQQLIAHTLAQAGACINLGWYQDITVQTMAFSIKKLYNKTKTYEKMANNCFNICDGKGADRVAKIVAKSVTSKHLTPTNRVTISNKITLHLATEEHCELIYRWQSNNNIRKYFINPEAPSWQEHLQWYHACLLDPNRILYLLHDNQENNVGLLRLDQLTKNEYSTHKYEISIIIAPEHQGKGIAVNALKKLSRLKKNAIYMATIHVDNIHSHRAFVSVGFQKYSQTHYQLNVINFTFDNKKIQPFIE
jgi:UDP-2,4-diacetamido-2,4,6-trideoxy-beta-L-altropyranose hydrolase